MDWVFQESGGGGRRDEVESRKASIIIDRPFQVGIAVFQLS